MYGFGERFFVREGEVRFYGFRLQTRMAVVRLEGRRLLLYSPVRLDAALRGELDRLGRVAFVIAPNKLHHLALAGFRSAYPTARFHAPPGLPERRPDLMFEGLLGTEADPEWREEMDQVLTAGNAFFSECLMFHRPSRTLLVADLVENFTRETASRWARAIAAPWGVRLGPRASPEFRFYTEDADAAASALGRVRAWDFERIFLCHGALVDSDARAIFARVEGELLRAVRSRGPLARWLWHRIAGMQ